MDAELANLVEEPKACARARAPEYEDWWHRRWQHKLVVGATGDRVDYRLLGGVSGAGDWRVVKHRFDAGVATRWIERTGFKAEVGTTNRFFIHGIARP